MTNKGLALPEADKLCPSCGGPTKFEGRCNACIAADYDDFDDDGGCYECGGEGFVSDCFEEWACLDPEYGCDLCTRRCDLCHPRKPDPALQEVLAEALAQAADAPNSLPKEPSL